MKNFAIVALSFVFAAYTVNGQVTSDDDVAGRTGSRIISTPVSFLTITPDSRSAALGDAGVAASPDVNANYWNPAKLAWIDGDVGASISYAPWLRKLVDDMSVSYLSGFKKLRKEEAIGFYLSYFNLGNMQFKDENNNDLGNEFRPRELAVGGNYSRKLSKVMSVSLGLKYIYSNLTNGISLNGGSTQTKPGKSAAADLGFYYNNEVMMGGRMFDLAFGGNISNLGGKISYSNNDQADFIPTNFRIGTSLTTEIDEYNKITFLLDLNKLMVPSPNFETEETDKGFISGVFGSFADAPDGVSEELKEWMISAGIEYWYTQFLAARAGYFHESALKGNRKYMTFGLGIRHEEYGFDFAYLVPTGRNNPLQDTLRFTLLYTIKNASPEGEDSILEGSSN